MSSDAWGLPALPARPDDPWSSTQIATRGHRATEGADGGALVDIRHGLIAVEQALAWHDLEAGAIPEGGSFMSSYHLAHKSIQEYPSSSTVTTLWELWANLEFPLTPSITAMFTPHDWRGGAVVEGSNGGEVIVAGVGSTTITYSLTWDFDVYGIEIKQNLPTLTWATRPTGDLLDSLGQETITDGGASNDAGGTLDKYPAAFTITNPSSSKTYHTLRFVARIDSYSYSKPGGWTYGLIVADFDSPRLQQLDAFV